MGKSRVTRAGVEGDIISTAVLQGTTATNASQTVPGFGVFGIYSGGGTLYNALTDRTPNFMYNEKIYWNSTYWKYDILKYWPNGTSGASGNADNKNATSTTTNYLNFFAYAPYLAYGEATGSYGITSMSANNDTKNPWIGYTIDNVHFVDLLWGKAGESTNTTSGTVTGTSQTGAEVNTDIDGSSIVADVSKGNVNINLTKQEVDGQVKFLFKHALARIGGPAISGTLGSGFLVKLDIDNSENGEVPVSPAITGGERQKFTVSETNDAWRTKVTIKEIIVTNDLNGENGIDGEEVGQYTTGILDLATGSWQTTGSAGVMTKDFGTSTATTPNKTYSADLNEKLAEGYDNSGVWATWISKSAYSTKSNYFLVSEDTSHPGVTEDYQNVYNSSAASPLTLIPGTTPKFKVTVTYVVRTYDDKLSTLYTEVTQTISKTIEFTSQIEMNKRYNVRMHLGLTTVKFDATVAEWEEGTISDSDGDGTQDNEVYLPINVL